MAVQKRETQAQKAQRYQAELNKGKQAQNGKPLTKGQKSYRHGYINATKPAGKNTAQVRDMGNGRVQIYR